MNIFKDSNLDTTKLMPGIEMQKVGDAVRIVGESLRIIIPSTIKFNEIARGVCLTTSGELYLMKNQPLWYFLAGGGRYEAGDVNAEAVLKREIAEEIGSKIIILSIRHLTDYLEIREQAGKQVWMRLTHAFIVEIDDSEVGEQNHDEGELERKTEVIKVQDDKAILLLDQIYPEVYASKFVKAIEPALVALAKS